MSELNEQLQKAQKRRTLVNVYQVNTEVVYTGYVKRVGGDSFILETYNDNGIRDGGVLLKTAIVDFVETESYDLDHMKKLIHFAGERGLHHEENDLLLTSSMGLTNSLLMLLREQHFLAMMITTRAGSSDQYEEGVVLKFDSQQVLLDRVDKFNFNKREIVAVPLDQLVGIEFGGQEMVALNPLLDLMVPAKHVEVQALDLSTGDLANQIGQYVGNRKLVIVQPKNGGRYFYIGQFLVANKSEVIMKMVDANGQFGGYVWFRYDDIDQVITVSDYLQVVEAVVAENEEWHRFAVPVLNDERDFDSNDNNLLRIIGQSHQSRTVIRFESITAGTITGIIKTINQEDATITIATRDDDLLLEKTIGIETIVEMAFEYLKAYLAQRGMN